MSTSNSAADEILRGLRLPQKTVSPKYFYDERGSALFERICELPEYYLTRTEISIMRKHLHEMASSIGPRANVIEFGIGSGLKTQLLLEHLDEPVAFVPVDISAEHLAGTVDELRGHFPGIEMLPVAADFTRPFPVPCPAQKPDRNLVYFPGSTIGNFEPDKALELLRVMRSEAGDDGLLLIGIDLKKDPGVLHAAYNDSEGVTAAFNLNLLVHLNRDFAANFDIENFRHQAVYDQGEGRIEMRLVSQCDQTVNIAGEQVAFVSGEHILTEYSHKHSVQEFIKMAQMAGFRPVKSWQDSRQWFGILLFESV